MSVSKPHLKIMLMLAVLCLAMGSRSETLDEDHLTSARLQMVAEQIENRGITDERVLTAMKKVKRHLFVPAALRNAAYDDRPLPIGYGQTISQPYIVAYMTQVAKIRPGDRVLEIGTGSGYQAAILAELAKEVFTIEILKPLADSAHLLLDEMGYRNITVKEGDGYKGWSEYAPFDCIIVTAAPPEIPPALLAQLKVGGRMVVPVGGTYQDLYLITRTHKGIKKEVLLPVIFVPMVHPAPTE